MKTNILDAYINNSKPYIVGFLLFVVSIFVSYSVIVPQWNVIKAKRSGIAQIKRDIEGVKSSVQTINALDSVNLNRSLDLTKTTLPDKKDIVAFYNALTAVASQSNVSIKSFSLKIGDLYQKDTSISQLSSNQDSLNSNQVRADVNSRQTISSLPQTVGVTLEIEGGDDKGVYLFQKNIYRALPLAEVYTASINERSAKFEINFYYKEYNSKLIAKQTNIKPLSEAQKNLISKLKEWQKKLQDLPTPPVASGVLPTSASSPSAILKPTSPVKISPVSSR